MSVILKNTLWLLVFLVKVVRGRHRGITEERGREFDSEGCLCSGKQRHR